MTRIEDIIVWVAALLGLLLMLHGKPASAQSLDDTAKHWGFKASKTVITSIENAAKHYGLDSKQMLAIAVIESSLKPSAIGYNTNGTIDIGLFQINEKTANSDCEEYNVFNLKGNVMCAAKLLAKHKKTGDALYIGRFHNNEITKKYNYYLKVKKAISK